MKAVLIGPTHPYRGGIAHYTTSLYLALAKENEVLFVSFSYQYPDWLFPGKSDLDNSRKPLKAKDVRRIIHPFKPWTWIKAFQVIKQFQPDIVLFPWWHWYWTIPFVSLMHMLKQNLTSPIVSICHNALHHENTQLSSMATKLVLKNATHIIVHSQKERERIINIGLKKPIFVHPHPITLDIKGDNDFLSVEDCRAQLGISGAEKVILFFGFIRPYKGLDVLLEAIALVIKEMPVRLLVVGEFWEDKDKYINTIDNLKLNEYITIVDKYISNEEIPWYFKACDVVALPYKDVTGSGILPLAIQHHCPVVASRLGALADLIQDGNTGFLFNPGDVHGLAACIIKYFSTYQQDWMRQQVVKLKSKISWESYLVGLSQLIQK